MSQLKVMVVHLMIRSESDSYSGLMFKRSFRSSTLSQAASRVKREKYRHEGDGWERRAL
jgi:hypothetical protein